MKKIWGIVLTIVGAISATYGFVETNSWEYQLATGFGVDSPEITMIRVCLYGGVIVTVMGVILLVVGMAKDTSK